MSSHSITIRTDRSAVVVVYQPLAPTPARHVFVPRDLAEPIGEVYARAGMTRTVDVASEPLPRVPTCFETATDRRRGSWRMTIEQVGDDLGACVAAEGGPGGVHVWHVDLPMAAPALGAAVDVLRGQGFFFASVLPEFLDGDVLRLQRIATTAMVPPDLVTEDARRLFRAIAEDHARALR